MFLIKIYIKESYINYYHTIIQMCGQYCILAPKYPIFIAFNGTENPFCTIECINANSTERIFCTVVRILYLLTVQKGFSVPFLTDTDTDTDF